MPSIELQAVAEAIRTDREFWRALVDEVGRDRMDEPGPMGEWTFKDLTAHLAAWRNARIPMLEAIARGTPVPAPPWPADMADDDAINAWFQERDSARSLDDVLDDYDRSFDRLARVLEAMPDDLARDPNAMPWARGSVIVDSDFTEHLHEEHLPSIRAWLDNRAG
jgi:hypothetical protein